MATITLKGYAKMIKNERIANLLEFTLWCEDNIKGAIKLKDAIRQYNFRESNE